MLDTEAFAEFRKALGSLRDGHPRLRYLISSAPANSKNKIHSTNPTSA